MKSIVIDALAIIRVVITQATAVISAVWARFGGTILRFITTTMKNIGTVVAGAFQVIAGLFKAVKAILTGDWAGLWAAIKQIVSGALAVVRGIIAQAWNVIRSVTSAAWAAIRALVAKAWEGIRSAIASGISRAVALVRSLPGRITGALGNLGSLLFNAGVDLLQGLLDGIGSMVDKVKSKLGEVTNLIPDWKGPPTKDRQLLRGAGQLIMQGLVDGFEDGRRGVRRSLQAVSDEISTTMGRRARGTVSLGYSLGTSDWRTSARTADVSGRRAAEVEQERAGVTGLREELRALRAAVERADYGNREELRRNGAEVARATGAPLRLGAQRAASWGGGG